MLEFLSMLAKALNDSNQADAELEKKARAAEEAQERSEKRTEASDEEVEEVRNHLFWNSKDQYPKLIGVFLRERRVTVDQMIHMISRLPDEPQVEGFRIARDKKALRDPENIGRVTRQIWINKRAASDILDLFL
jgi:hypothetical protein